MATDGITFGFAAEWDAFLARHPRFVEKLKGLTETFQKAFVRHIEMGEPADRVVFFLGRLSVEDFMEVLLLCGNGYGFGGMKLLRGLYEKAVTLGYIAKNPDKAEQFLEYHYVHQGKQFNHATKVFPMKEHLSASQIDEIQDRYKKAKGKYQEVVCKKCGTTKTMPSWSELDVLSMARKAGLDKSYLQCFYDPTLQVHTTFSSIAARFRLGGDGQVTFDQDAQRKNADSTLICSHQLILYVLDTENGYFKMGLEDEIQERFADFLYAWKT